MFLLRAGISAVDFAHVRGQTRGVMGDRAVKRATRPLAVVAGIALLIAVIALASRPPAGAVTPLAGPAVTRTVMDSVFYLLVALGLVAGLTLVWVLWPQEELGPRPRPERRRHSLLAALAVAVTLVLLVWWRSGRWGRLPLLGAGIPSIAAPPLTARGGASGGVVAQGLDWPAIAVTALVLAVVAALVWRQLRPPRRALRVLRSPLPEMERVLEDALVDAAAESDPRRAVLAAWARTERLLAEHDARRRPSEAPFEFAARAAAAVGLDAGALERLAGLYEWARFSVHEVTSAMRREALDGLAQVRERLRLAS
jgi:hypothetical protein